MLGTRLTKSWRRRCRISSFGTCELQGNDSPGFGMRKCRGFTHPVLLLISSSAHSRCSCSVVTRHYKSFSQFPVLVSPGFSVHMSSSPCRSLLLGFYSLCSGMSLSQLAPDAEELVAAVVCSARRSMCSQDGSAGQGVRVCVEGARQALWLQPRVRDIPLPGAALGWTGAHRDPGAASQGSCRALLVPLLGASPAAYRAYFKGSFHLEGRRLLGILLRE